MTMLDNFPRLRNKMMFMAESKEESFAIVYLAVGLCVMIGVMLMVTLTSCLDKKDNENRTVYMAEESLRLTLDHPESLNIITVSKLDSVFGKNYFTESELQEILADVTAFNERYFSSTNFDIENPALLAQIQRGSTLSDIIQSQIAGASESDKFTGWKMKVLYECRDIADNQVKNERYIFFDKDLKYIIHSFDIPLL